MGIRYTPEQRKRMSEESKGKTIESLEWEDQDEKWGEYWVMKFTDGSETSIRFMSELI